MDHTQTQLPLAGESDIPVMTIAYIYALSERVRVREVKNCQTSAAFQTINNNNSYK